MTTIAVDAAQLDQLRRTTMKRVAGDLRDLADELDELSICSHVGDVFRINSTDTKDARDLVNESMGTLGWPE